MGLREKLKKGEMGIKLTQGFYRYEGEDPFPVAGSTKFGDIHRKPNLRGDNFVTHVPTHTIHDIKGEPIKYTDNLPE